MRKTWIVPLVVLSAPVSTMSRPATAAESAFPSYAREDVIRVCLSEYGVENSSVLDCLAQDQKVRDLLSRKWADLADSSKINCVQRLANGHANSYSHLDRCVRSAEKERDAAAPDQ